MKFVEPPYEIYTVTGEEHIHLDFFLKIKTYDSVTLKDIIYITLGEENDNKTFWMKESKWIEIQREIKLNTILNYESN
jgi:hypothetical protein